ncbi:hypothetical protein NFI96_000753 [Prochilodus magdalenae]|nr:hypothetical protein NFI96_000753 [Prochilodus magdalenae]
MEKKVGERKKLKETDRTEGGDLMEASDGEEDAQENKLSLISGHGTALRRCPSQPEDKFSSTYDYGCSRNDGPEAPNQDLEGVEATGHMRLELQDLQRRQYARKKLIHDMCRHNGTLRFMKKATINDIPNDQLSNLIVDDRHGIIYCYVPKVACTEWKSIMIFLSESLKVNGTPYRNHSDIPRDLIHGNSIIYLNRARKTVMKWKIQKY